MDDINKIEEISVAYTICNYCIHKNKPLKVIMKILSMLKMDNLSAEDISMLIFNMDYNWNKINNCWEQNTFHKDYRQDEEPTSELPDKPVKLDFSLLDSEKEINVSPNDALTLPKNMANIQSTLNKILNNIKKTDKYSF